MAMAPEMMNYAKTSVTAEDRINKAEADLRLAASVIRLLKPFTYLDSGADAMHVHGGVHALTEEQAELVKRLCSGR